MEGNILVQKQRSPAQIVQSVYIKKLEPLSKIVKKEDNNNQKS
jgi:hypothetical protein